MSRKTICYTCIDINPAEYKPIIDKVIETTNGADVLISQNTDASADVLILFIRSTVSKLSYNRYISMINPPSNARYKNVVIIGISSIDEGVNLFGVLRASLFPAPIIIPIVCEKRGESWQIKDCKNNADAMRDIGNFLCNRAGKLPVEDTSQKVSCDAPAFRTFGFSVRSLRR